jgi:hypothetical protein
MTEPFTNDPPRLLESDIGLRHDLETARAARVDYSVEAGLARFEASLAGATTLPSGGTVAGFAVLRWFLGTSALLGVAVVAWLTMRGEPEADSHAGTPTPALADESNQVRSEDEEVAVIASQTHAVASDASSVVDIQPKSSLGSDVHESVAETQQPGGNGKSGASARSDGGEPAGQLAASPRPASKSPAVEEPAVEEAKLIDAARKALADDPARTLELTEQAADRFPAGAMIQERRGYAILALLALDRRAEAEDQADEYLERWPKGPLSRRIREGLGLLP